LIYFLANVCDQDKKDFRDFDDFERAIDGHEKFITYESPSKRKAKSLAHPAFSFKLPPRFHLADKSW
jgi:hypothetical protein